LSRLEQYEPGGHRLQRVPPTERKGRVHTSTVTVAVINPEVKEFRLNDNDLKVEWYSGTGAGGQNRNKVKNSCRLIHKPTGIIVTAQTRDRSSSLCQAKQEIEKRLKSLSLEEQVSKTALIRKNQVGSGMRGDKIRTIRFQDNTVIDHITGNKMPADRYMKGFIDDLWNN
jgi:peptide chain release factor 1